MNSRAFDSLKFANRLKTADIPPQQAEALTQALSEVLEASRDDLATKADLREGLQELRAEIKELRTETKADMQELRAEIDKRFAAVDTRFAEFNGKFTLLQWMLGVIVAGVVTLIAKAFLHA